MLALSVTSREFWPGFLATGGNASLPSGLVMPFGMVTAFGLFNGFVEELGWTGFAIHRLRMSHAVLATGVVTGFLWGAWHYLATVWGADPGPLPLVVYIAAVVFSFLPPYRVLMVWVYEHTQSLLLAILMHASADVFWMLSVPVGIGRCRSPPGT